MEEKIYTIPVNMAFEKKDGCPFCTLHEELEQTELTQIMGASMMEPDIRIQTNEKGFCRNHLQKMFERNNRLSLALMLQSHLDHITDGIAVKQTLFGKDPAAKSAETLDRLTTSCYVCEKIHSKLDKMFSTTLLLWERESDFRTLFAAQPCFCLVHYDKLLHIAPARLSKKQLPAFLQAADEIQRRYLAELKKDVDWFCKKFDYRYDKEPWGNAKDAVERAIHFLQAKGI